MKQPKLARPFQSRPVSLAAIFVLVPSYSEIATALTKNLHLSQPPIAVSFSDNVPAAIPTWSGHSPAGCRFWQEAATRVFVTSAEDHRFCSIGQYTHNLNLSPASSTDLKDALKVFADLTYVRDEDIAMIPVLASRPKHVIYGPLAQFPLDPGVVLLFVRANQTLILSEAAQQLETGMPPSASAAAALALISMSCLTMLRYSRFPVLR